MSGIPILLFKQNHNLLSNQASSDVVAPKKELDTYLTNAIAYLDGTYTGNVDYSDFIAEGADNHNDKHNNCLIKYGSCNIIHIFSSLLH